MSPSPRIVSFHTAVDPDHSRPAADRVLAGDPQLTVWNHYADASEQFFAGVWSATRGRWRIRYTEAEFCHLLAGRVRLVGEDGDQNDFRAGDSFVVPSGFAGTWEVLEDCRKLYVIFEPR